MATDSERMREIVKQAAVREIPKRFLLELFQRLDRAYQDEFLDMQHRTVRIEAQKRANLIDERFYRADHELMEAAKSHGLSATANPLPENTWRHVFVSCGSFGFTQSYVRKPGDLPQPAKFRDNLASAAKMPRLALYEDKEIFEPKDFYAIFTHSPIGSEFKEEKQRLGSLMFSVPYEDMRGWQLNISIGELLAEYPVVKEEKKDRGPTWKRRDKREGEQ